MKMHVLSAHRKTLLNEANEIRGFEAVVFCYVSCNR